MLQLVLVLSSSIFCWNSPAECVLAFGSRDNDRCIDISPCHSLDQIFDGRINLTETRDIKITDVGCLVDEITIDGEKLASFHLPNAGSVELNIHGGQLYGSGTIVLTSNETHNLHVNFLSLGGGTPTIFSSRKPNNNKKADYFIRICKYAYLSGSMVFMPLGKSFPAFAPVTKPPAHSAFGGGKGAVCVDGGHLQSYHIENHDPELENVYIKDGSAFTAATPFVFDVNERSQGSTDIQQLTCFGPDSIPHIKIAGVIHDTQPINIVNTGKCHIRYVEGTYDETEEKTTYKLVDTTTHIQKSPNLGKIKPLEPAVSVSSIDIKDKTAIQPVSPLKQSKYVMVKIGSSDVNAFYASTATEAISVSIKPRSFEKDYEDVKKDDWIKLTPYVGRERADAYLPTTYDNIIGSGSSLAFVIERKKLPEAEWYQIKVDGFLTPVRIEHQLI
ncbi:hypothetical protein BLNAU_4496 [Blattamonas nauphoetae]|uniref:Uncharacterized protein n=1 Tax=Blattamonas nauphoetae TaxID=2049346 RepID=A0ABQ9Y9Z8_9EUKA|nr:hypothetical protein BLNAU_4496 [Blattamonas nauphoetae]